LRGRVAFYQGRTQGVVVGLEPTLEFDMLQRLYYLLKGD